MRSRVFVKTWRDARSNELCFSVNVVAGATDEDAERALAQAFSRLASLRADVAEVGVVGPARVLAAVDREWRPAKEIARRCFRSLDTTKEHLLALSTRGAIERRQRPGKATLYRRRRDFA